MNPIFYKQSTGETPKKVLAKDSEIFLSHLDTFSLLPDQYIYEIRVVQDESVPDEIRNVEVAESVQDPERTPSPEYFKTKSQPLNEFQNSLPDKESSRKRSLSLDYDGEESKKQKQMPSISNANDAQNAVVPLQASGATDLLTNSSVPSIFAIKPDPDANVQSSEATGSKQILQVPNSVTIKPDPDANTQSTSLPTTNTVVNTSVAIKLEPANQSELNNIALRPSCVFGIRCYRNTSEHRREVAHPLTDEDYRRPVFPAAPDDAQECIYGASCYRRNPEHFREFKHPSSE